MPRLLKSSLRARLISAILLTTMPLMGLIWYGAQRQFVRDSLALEQEVQRLTAFIAGDVNHLLESTRQILVAVSEVGRGASPEVGRVILDNLARQCPYYNQFGVVNPAGPTYSSEPSVGTAAELIDEELTRRAAESKRLVLGGFLTGAADGKNFLRVAYCAAGDGSCSTSTVSFVLLDMGWLDALLSEERVTGDKSLFPRDMILNVLDRSGTILTRHPDKEKWTGQKLPDSQVLHEIMQKGEGSADLIGISGVRRLYAFKSVAAVSGDIMVSIGVSRESALAAARKDMRRILACVSAVGLLLMLAAWVGTGLFITRPLASLVAATQRLGAGDLGARTGVTHGPQEIAHLAGAFDGMAQILERDAREREGMRAKLIEYDRQLRSMSVAAALAEEQERKQVAAGLHDKAGPLLATCYMKLGRALKLTAPPGVTAALGESRELIDRVIGELRTLTFDLSSPALYTLGLPAAVEEVCRDTAKRHSLEITFQDHGTPQALSNDKRVVLYRAARELLLNVVKHAEATRVTVTCGGDAEEVFVAVVDDGVGFEAAEAGRGFSRTGGFGLFSLRERLEHLGGRFTVESSRGTGTRVVVAVPALAGGGQEEAEHDDQHSPG